jgi:hypothetical protein
VDLIILVDFPTREVFSEIYKKGYSQPAINKNYDILVMRAAGHTLLDCGKFYGVTKQRIRQIEAKFLRKMQEYRSSLKTDSL